MTITTDTHLEGWLAESAACEPTAWERWADAVEVALGHSADGDQETDGFSLDDLFALWREGFTVTDAVAQVERDKARVTA